MDMSLGTTVKWIWNLYAQGAIEDNRPFGKYFTQQYDEWMIMAQNLWTLKRRLGRAALLEVCQ
jgi:hypothetical protein